MNKVLRICPVVLLALFAGIYSGCEWESDDSSSYNTSQWSGVELNFSGQYVAREDGGELITGRPDITYLLITQTGNRLDIIDSLGVRYEGITGSPGVIAAPLEYATDGTPKYPNGTMMSMMQFTFWKVGSSPSIHDDIYFDGFLRLVAVTDIQGSTSQTDLAIDADPVTIAQSSTTQYSVDESNAMMVLEGQWREGETIGYVNGWSQNFFVVWEDGITHTFSSGEDAADDGGDGA